MKQGFRDALRVLEDAGELRRIKKAVDPRHFSALAAQAKEATFFEAIEGYPSWRAAGALVSTRKRLALAMGCSEADIARRFEDGIRRPVEIAVAVGVHPYEMLAASYKAPIDVDEYAIAGGLHGAPVDLVRCRTVDLEVPADAELVLEGELLPIGWTADEGPFGEFSHITGDVKWNPIFRVKCITHRRDPIFYMLQMPWENDWLAAPVIEAAGLQALRIASVEPVAIRAPVGGCCYWTLIASIRKRPGEGKNALLALLSVAEVKLAIVTDDDINIYDPDELDWAMTFRIQADHDVLIIPGARGKHIDPSVRAWSLGKGGLPTTAKLGIDATIPEGVPREQYERLRYFAKDAVRLEDYL